MFSPASPSKTVVPNSSQKKYTYVVHAFMIAFFVYVSSYAISLSGIRLLDSFLQLSYFGVSIKYTNSVILFINISLNVIKPRFL